MAQTGYSQARSSADETRQMERVRAWVEDAKPILQQRLLNDIEAGMRFFDPNFTIPPDARQRIADAMDSFLSNPERIFVYYREGDSTTGMAVAGSIGINAWELESFNDTLRVLSHELLHRIANPNSPFITNPDAFVEKYHSFSEGATELLSRFVMLQEGYPSNAFSVSAYPEESSLMYFLLASGAVTPDAFLSSFFGSAYTTVSDPDTSLRAQLVLLGLGPGPNPEGGYLAIERSIMRLQNTEFIDRLFLAPPEEQIAIFEEALRAQGADGEAIRSLEAIWEFGPIGGLQEDWRIFWNENGFNLPGYTLNGNPWREYWAPPEER